MSTSRRYFIPVCAAALLAACDANVLSPNRELSSAAMAEARAPAGPNLSTGAGSASIIGMSWTDNARNEAGWEVHRSTSGAEGIFSLRATLGANANYHSDEGLSALTEYCYKVRSFKKQGPSASFAAFSNTSCSTTFGPPAAPSGTSAVPRTSTVVDVAWTDNAVTEQSFRLERSADPAGPWQTAATLSVNASSFADFSRPPEQQACYRAIATNAYGESAPSNVDCTAPPQAPSGIAAASADAASIDVMWTDASYVEDGYEVQRALDDFVFGVVADLPAGAASYHDVAIVPDTRYWYRVRAKKDGGFSDYSGYAWAAAASGPPSAPSIYGASPAGSTFASFSWFNVSPTTTGHRVERSTDGRASWGTAGTVGGNDTWFFDGERTPELEVCYRVFAFNARGESGPSEVDCTIPPAAPSNLAVNMYEPDVQTVSWTDNSSVEEFYEVWTIICYDGWDCYYNVYWAEQNSSSLQIGLYEYLDAVYAYSDGGYSDPGTWAGAEGLARVSASPVVRPTKGARAPRPSASARAKGMSDRLLSARKPQ